MRVSWFGHSSVFLEVGGKRIFIDPYAGDDSLYSSADIILVSQFSFDHCSLSKVRRLLSDQSHILGTPELAREIFPCGVLLPGENRFFDGVEVVGMPGKALGFSIIGENKLVYFMGDNAFLPQTEGMSPDVLFIAVGNRAREAAKVVDLINPKLVIPIHWGGVNGSKDDALLLSELVSCPVKILEVGESFEV